MLFSWFTIYNFNINTIYRGLNRGDKMKKLIKKISIIILILIIGVVVPNYSQAVGDAFSDADDFLGKRRPNI